MAAGSEEEIAQQMALGVEPLSPAFSPRYLLENVQRTQRTVKDVVMDQRVIAGVGNIYASELLFRAGVRPSRIAATLDQQAVGRIVKVTKTVLKEAIRHEGVRSPTISMEKGNLVASRSAFACMIEKRSRAGPARLRFNGKLAVAEALSFVRSANSRY